LEVPTHLAVDKRLLCGPPALEVLVPHFQAKGWGIVQGIG